jgi:phosphoenolpyruvate-protein kinase (PTS system EI component)
MVEVPAAAVASDLFAREVDFFSIGTNDLTQYTLAADRGNPGVQQIADHFHPAVLRLIQLTINNAHRHGKWVGICGELAGELLAAPLLLGMRLDEFSMGSMAIPAVKNEIRHWSMAEAENLVEQTLNQPDAASVRAFLAGVIRTKQENRE